MTSWADFVNQFSVDPNKVDPNKVDPNKDTETQTGTRKKEPTPPPTEAGPSSETGTTPVVPAVRDPFGSDLELPFAVRGFYENGGSLAYIVPVQGLEKENVETAVTSLKAYGDVGLVCAPGVTDTDVQGAIVEHCRKMGDRFAILDGLWPAETAPEEKPSQKDKDASQKDKKDDADKSATTAAGPNVVPDPAPNPKPEPAPQTGAGTEVSTTVLVTNATGAMLELDPSRAYGAVYWPWLVTAGKPTDPPRPRARRRPPVTSRVCSRARMTSAYTKLLRTSSSRA